MEQFLFTKLNIPQLRSNLFPLTRLSEQLKEAALKWLILVVSAFPGFDKTTLVKVLLLEAD